MTTNQFISVRETAQVLSISEKKVMDLIEQRKLQAYKIADKFLRLKKSEVMDLKNSGAVTIENVRIDYSPAEKVRDFLYFNDFYILSFFAILALVYVIFFV